MSDYTFVWTGADVRRLIADATSVARHVERYPELCENAGATDDDPWEVSQQKLAAYRAADPENGFRAKPALEFVHDDGVYLMSNAAHGDGRKPLVAYAQGYEPGGEAAHHVRGDDFVEGLPIAGSIFEHIADADLFVIRFSPNEESFELRVVPGAVPPPPKRPRRPRRPRGPTGA